MKTKTVELPSGRKVEIREPGPRGMAQIIGTLPTIAYIEDDTDDDPSDDDKVREFVRLSREQRAEAAESQMEIVCACSHNPKFSTRQPTPKGYLDIDDLEFEDYKVLRDECIELISEKREATKENLTPLSRTRTA